MKSYNDEEAFNGQIVNMFLCMILLDFSGGEDDYQGPLLHLLSFSTKKKVAELK